MADPDLELRRGPLLKRVVHGGGLVSGTIHGRKNNESRITDIEISFPESRK